MFNIIADSHYKTLKGWKKSAEQSRAKLLSEVADAAGGVYKVKMAHSGTWQLSNRPPEQSATEWLYVDGKGVPIYYWNKEQNGLTII